MMAPPTAADNAATAGEEEETTRDAQGRNSEQATRAINSFVAFKGHLTGKINQATKLLRLTERQQITPVMKDSLKLQLSIVREYHEKVIAANNKIYEHDLTTDEAAKFIKEMETIDKTVNTCTLNLTDMMQHVELELTAAARVAAQQQQAARHATDKTKPNEALKPKALSRDAMPAEVRVWMKNFESYHTSSHMQLASIKEQQAYFYSCLDPYLQHRMQSQCQDELPVIAPNGVDSCMTHLKEEFLLKHPLFARHLDFFRCKQKLHQTFTDWTQELKRKGDEADLDDLNSDELYTLRYLTGGIDDELRARFLKQDPKTRDAFDKIAQQYEVGKRYLKAIEKTSQPAAAEFV